MADKQLVAWGRDAAGTARSHWLLCTTERCNSEAERPGIIAAAAGNLWELVLPEARFASYDCDDDPNTAKLQDPEGVRVVGARVRALSQEHGSAGPSEHVLVTIADPSADGHYPVEYQQSVGILGSLNGQLFVQVGSVGFFCGTPHGNAGSSFVLWELATHRSVTPLDALWSDSERQQLHDKEWRLARDKLREELEGTPDEGKIERMELSALSPTFTTTGVTFEATFTAPACRTCSDGVWSDYTVAAQVPLTTPVATLHMDASTVAAAHAALARSGLRLAGLSHLEDEPAKLIISLRRRFEHP